MVNKLEKEYPLTDAEWSGVHANVAISDFDKRYLSQVDLRLLKDENNNSNVRSMIATLRLKRSVSDLNASTTRLMWAQIVIAIVAICVALGIAIFSKYY